MHTPASPTLVSFRRHGRRGPITRPHVDSIPTADREQNFGKSPRRVSSLHLHRLWLPCHRGQIVHFMRGMFHLDSFLAVPPYEYPERDFLPCTPTSANIPPVCQPYTHFFLPQHLTFGGRIDRRERKTNHQVRVGATGPSNHTYLFPHLFVVLRFPSAQSSHSSILQFQRLPSQSRDCDRIHSAHLFCLSKVHLQPIGRPLFPCHFRPVHLDDVL